jgi:hypothetical protein
MEGVSQEVSDDGTKATWCSVTLRRTLLRARGKERAAPFSAAPEFAVIQSYFDRLRFVPMGCFAAALVSFLVGWLSFFTLPLTFANSDLTPVAIFAESTLYRVAARARLEFLSSACLGSYPGRKPGETWGRDGTFPDHFA